MTSAMPLSVTQAHSLRLAFAGLLAITVGCSAPDADPLETTHEALNANDKTAYDYFLGKGLTNFQAAGVVGNLDQESGVDPTIHQQGGGVGRGIAQWSTGARWDTTNNDNVLAFATQKGQSATSLGLQLDFMWYELTTFPEYGLADLKATANITDATQVVEDKYEGCVYANYPECALPARINFAKGIFAAYGADTGPGGAGGGGAGAGGVASGGGASASSGAGDAATAGSSGATVGGASGSSAVGGTDPSGNAGTATGAAGSINSGGTSAAGGSSTIAGSPGIAGAPSAASTSGAIGGTTFASTSPATSGVRAARFRHRAARALKPNGSPA